MWFFKKRYPQRGYPFLGVNPRSFGLLIFFIFSQNKDGHKELKINRVAHQKGKIGKEMLTKLNQ
jgi:hypothetical protein